LAPELIDVNAHIDRMVRLGRQASPKLEPFSVLCSSGVGRYGAEGGTIMSDHLTAAVPVRPRFSDLVPDPGEPTPVPDPGEPTPLPDPGEPTPLPDPGEPTPVPDPGEPTPVPDPGEPRPLPDPGEPTLAVDTGAPDWWR
jgi:hypothetical protein